MDYNNIINNIKNNEKYRILNIDYNKIEFFYIENFLITKKNELYFGNKTIEEKYFHHCIPSYAEVEYAINFIEDELMSNKELLNDNDELYIDERFMMEIFFFKNKIVTRDEIEEIFTQYALISMGKSPIYDDVDMNKEKYSKLLILREIMHHLDFACINLH